MGKVLTLEISDDSYAMLQRRAEVAGTSPAHLAATALERELGAQDKRGESGDAQTEVQKQSARERFERHFGEVDLCYATGADNESVDADLAKEYSDNHKGA